MRWPWRRRPEPPRLTDIRYNGTYFEVLTSITYDSVAEHETWDPYIDELMRWRYVEVRPDVLAEPLTTVYDELVAEGWTPPGDRDLPPVLCLARMARSASPGDGGVCLMLAGHSGDHQDLITGWAWRG